MKPARTYPSAVAFRRALEDRLRSLSAREGVDLARLQKRIAFERLLARLFAGANPPWLLKGGYALEMRLRDAARATKDLDLTVPDVLALGLGEGVPGVRNLPDQLLERLRDAAEGEAEPDGFEFRLGTAMKELMMAPLAGARYPVECLLAGRTFTKFHLDVGVGDAVVQAPEQMEGHGLLDFAGIPRVRATLVPLTTHFSEKLHAYTLPRADGALNSRVRDLADMVLLIQMGLNANDELVRAVRATFNKRATHPVPVMVPPPPENWSATYSEIAAATHLAVDKVAAAHQVVAEFWQPLSGEGDM